MRRFTRQRFVGFLLAALTTASCTDAAVYAAGTNPSSYSSNYRNKPSLGSRLKMYDITGKKGELPPYTDAAPVIMPSADPQVIKPIEAPTKPGPDLPVGAPIQAIPLPEPGPAQPGTTGGSAAGSQAGGASPGQTPASGAQHPSATTGGSDSTVPLRGPIGPGDSLTIGQAMNETLINSPRAAAVRFNLGVTRSELIRATEMPNPTIFMDSGYKAEFTYRYGASIPVQMPWKLVFRILAAKKQIKQTDFEIRNALWQLRGDIRHAYTELVVAQETYETLVDLYELSARLYEVAGKRFQAGDVPELDVLKARLLAGQNAIERDVGARRVVQARQSLAILLGRKVETPVEVPRLSPFKLKAEIIDLLPDFNKEMPKLDLLLAAAKQNRLELKVLNQSIAAAKAQLRNAYGEVLPDPTLGIGSSVVNGPGLDPRTIQPGDALPRNVFHGYFVQVFQPLPIFDLNQGDISKYRATIRQLNAQITSQQNVIEQEVSAAYQKVLASRQRIQTYQEKLLNDSNEVARLSRRSYEVGQSDITSTLLTQQANIQIRNQYLDAVNSYQQAFTDLEQSIGTILQ